MFTQLAAIATAFLARQGLKTAAALLPYVATATPLVVFAGSCAAFYLRHKADTFDLTLAALVVANEAIVAAQIGTAATPSK